MSELCKGRFCRAGSRRSKKKKNPSPGMWSFQNKHVFLRPLNASSSLLSPDPHPSPTPPLHPEPVLLATVHGPSSAPARNHEARSPAGSLLPPAPGGLRAPDLLLQSARPRQRGHDPAGQDPHVRAHGERRAHAHASTCIVCFTRSVQFQKTCAEVLPAIFIDVHVSQNTWVNVHVTDVKLYYFSQ